MKKLLLALLVVSLAACAPATAVEDPLPGYVPAEVDVYSDGLTTDGAVWTNVTWVEVYDSSTGVVFYQATITGASVHFIFDPQAGTDYVLESDETLVVGVNFEMIDPYGLFWGTLTLEANGSVTWTAPSNGEYVPDAPTDPSTPQGIG